jgi:4-hydroxy-3-methylbut-2-enyl diphosphate reductase
LTLAIASGAVGLFMAFIQGPVLFLILCIISLLGLLYKVKIVPGRLKIGKKIQRISDVPGSKTVLIALAWGIVTAFLPHLSVSLQITTTMLFVSLWASVMAFVRTAFFDILDMQGDRIVGQESLPIVLGKRKTFRILEQLLVIFLVALIFAPVIHLTTTLAYGMILSVFYMAAVLAAFERQWVVPGFRFEFLVETLAAREALPSGRTCGVSARYCGSTPLSLMDCKYSSHSIGSIYFFLLLHSLHEGTTFPLVDFPPLDRGTT